MGSLTGARSVGILMTGEKVRPAKVRDWEPATYCGSFSQSLDSLTVGLSSFNTRHKILFQPSFSFLTEHDFLCWSLKVGIDVPLQFPCEGLQNNLALSFVSFVICWPFLSFTFSKDSKKCKKCPSSYGISCYNRQMSYR